MVKQDRDSVLIGGPYNGNSFYVEEDKDEFRILYLSHSTSYAHVYTRSGDHRYTYHGIEHLAGPQTGVQLSNPSGQEL